MYKYCNQCQENWASVGVTSFVKNSLIFILNNIITDKKPKFSSTEDMLHNMINLTTLITIGLIAVLTSMNKISQSLYLIC